MLTHLRKNGLGAGWLALPAVAWLLVFTIMPLAYTLLMSFWRSELFGTVPEFNLQNYYRIFTEPIYLEILLRTIRVAIGTTILCLVISYPVAWFMSKLSSGLRTAVTLAIFLPFWVSYIVRTFVWLPILGRNGAVNQALLYMGLVDKPVDWLIYSEFALYLGLVYVYLLFMLLPILLSMDRIDRSLFEAAHDLGAGTVSLFTRIIIPLSLPGIISGCVMVFLLACGAFVTPQLLGGPSGTMFGNVIADQLTIGNNWAFGAALSVVLILVVMIFIAVLGRKLGLERIFLQAR